jgi:serine/threonine-protein kinase
VANYSPEFWREITPVIDIALELPEAERLPWLDARSDLPEAVRAAARSFLVALAQDEARDFLGSRTRYDEVLGEALAEAPREGASPGDEIGPYRVLSRLGEGGMGAVYLAEHRDGLVAARVALKLVRPGMVHAALLARFERERRVLGRLDHPRIARLRDAGVSHGAPYIALDYVEGLPITQHAEAAKLGLAARIQLVLHVADAVAYAHRQLVVHRDLKPSNILVTSEGKVSLLDFGIAKLIDGDQADESDELTRVFGAAASPDYAAPEQLTGGRISTQSDVFSLGVVLYELLTGQRPFRRADGTEATAPATAPSQAPFSEAAVASSGLTRQRLRRALSGDLDAILMKALSIRPEARYASIEAFAADLERYLRQQPVAARGDWLAYRVSRFVQRNRWAVAGATAVTLALIGGAAGLAWQAEAVRREAAKTAAMLRFTHDMLRSADPDRSAGAEVPIRKVLQQGMASIRSEMQGQPALAHSLYAALCDINASLNDFPPAEAACLAALKAAQTAFGENSIEALNSEIKLAEILPNLERREQIPQLESLWRKTEARLGRDHPTTLAALAHYVQLATQWPDHPGARDLARLRHDRISAHYGPRHWRSVRAANDYAVFLTRMGDWKAAAVVLEATDLSVLEPGMPNRREPIIRRYNLAAIQTRLGEYEKAEALLRQSVADYSALLGKDNVRTIEARESLAALLWGSGRFAEADAEYRALAPLRRQSFDTVPRHYAYILCERINIALAEGDLPRAVALADELQPIAEQRFAAPHNTQAYALRSAGIVRALQGDGGRAEALIQRAAAVEKAVAPNLAPYPQTHAARGLAETIAGRHEKAAEAFAAAVDANRKSPGGLVFGTARYLMFQSAALLRQGDRAEAALRLAEARGLLESSTLPRTHPRWQALAALEAWSAGRGRGIERLGGFLP